MLETFLKAVPKVTHLDFAKDLKKHEQSLDDVKLVNLPNFKSVTFGYSKGIWVSQHPYKLVC